MFSVGLKRPNRKAATGSARCLDPSSVAASIYRTMNDDKSRLSLLRHRDFCVFWTGSFLSSIGTQFTTVAMAWQIHELTNSGPCRSVCSASPRAAANRAVARRRVCSPAR